MAHQPEDCVPGRKLDAGMAQQTEVCVPGRKRDARMSQQSEEWVPGWQRDAGVKVMMPEDKKRLKDLKEKDVELIRLIEENKKLKDLCDIKSSLLKQTEEFWNQRERALEQTINILKEEKYQRAALEKDNGDLRGMGKNLETEVNNCHFKMEEMLNANKTLQIKLDSSEQAVNDFKYKLDKSNKVFRANVDMYEAKLKSMEDHCAALTKEKDDLRDRRAALEKDNGDLRGMGKNLETEVNNCHFKMEKMLNANKTLQIKLDSSEQAVNDFKYKLDKSNKVFRANVDMYEANLKSMEDHCAALTKEKDDLRDRFSKLAGDKNADIADLSDAIRPLKISEKAGTLYDDEWTDAFQELTDHLKMERQDAIHFLLDCLRDCFQISEKVAEQQFDSLKNVFLLPAQDTNFVPESKGRLESKDEQALRDIRRKIGAKHGASVKQIFFMTLNKNKTNEKWIPLVKPYLEKLADVCWLMAICDPPMYMDMTVKRGSKLDSNVYTPHTSSGKTVEYLVWPPLYNCKSGGGLISKGVVATERVVSKK